MTLRSAISTPDGKQRYVRRLFATIADRYDFITGFLSFGLDRGWKRRVVRLADVTASDRVLDLACGTGDLLFEAAPHVRQAIGLDVTSRMIELARVRARAEPGAHGAGASPRWLVGDMIALPFPDARFDLITTGYGLRNVPDLDRALAEIHRVLAPGGRMLSLDFNRPSNVIVRGAYLTYLTIVGSLLGLALHGDPDTYRYIPESIRKYPGARGVARMMDAHGFRDVTAIPVLFGFMAIHVAHKR